MLATPLFSRQSLKPRRLRFPAKTAPRRRQSDGVSVFSNKKLLPIYTLEEVRGKFQNPPAALEHEDAEFHRDTYGRVRFLQDLHDVITNNFSESLLFHKLGC